MVAGRHDRRDGAGHVGLAVQELGGSGLFRPSSPALLILGSSGVISMLLPYAAENYPLRIRGRATGWVAACSKLGGLIAQVELLAGVPRSRRHTAIAVPAVASTILIARFGRESPAQSGELDAPAPCAGLSRQSDERTARARPQRYRAAVLHLPPRATPADDTRRPEGFRRSLRVRSTDERQSLRPGSA